MQMASSKRSIEHLPEEQCSSSKRQLIAKNTESNLYKQTVHVHGISVLTATSKPTSFDPHHITKFMDDILARFSLEHTTLAKFLKRRKDEENVDNPAQLNNDFVDFMNIVCIILQDCMKGVKLLPAVTNSEINLSSSQSPSIVFKQPKPNEENSTFSQYWQNHYQELVNFKKKHGHCNVSKTTKGWGKLGNWLSDQRRKLRKGKMTQQQYQMMNELDESKKAIPDQFFDRVPSMSKASFLEAHLAKKLNERSTALQNVRNGKPKFPDPIKTNDVVLDSTSNSNNADTTSKKANFISFTKADDLCDYKDEEDIAQLKAKELAKLIQNAKNLIIYTGAGISTAAQIPDYRSSNGVWTMREQVWNSLKLLTLKGLQITKDVRLDEVTPTKSHFVISELVNRDICKSVVSTNIDGLHLKSGVPADKLCSLHGDCYVEVCETCKKNFVRSFSVIKEGVEDSQSKTHYTDRLCDCGGKLKDTIVHFGEDLPQDAFQKASELCLKVDLALVLGSSMRVSPACNMPRRALNNGGKLVIVNFQKTPFEDEAWIHIYAPIDDVMKVVLDELSISSSDQQ